MRASTLLLAVTALTGCRLQTILDDLGELPFTASSDSLSDPSTSGSGGEGLPTTSFGPIATVTGATMTGGETGDVAIVDVQLPVEALGAGPLPLVVKTEYAESVTVALDEGAPWPMTKADAEMTWSFDLPVLGAVDEGEHTVTVTAMGGSGEAIWTGEFTVTAPAPGTVAWSKPIKGTPGISRALAVMPSGDVVEAGATWSEGAMRASVRRRSAEDGDTVWSTPTIVLWPELEGEATGIAAAPDGTLWVVANVNAQGQPQHPRLAHLDGEGKILWVHEGADGQRMFDVAADAEGGCVAVGSTPAGDTNDGKLWFVSAQELMYLSPSWWHEGNADQSFDEVFEGVTIADETVIVGGPILGPHDVMAERTRSAVVRFELQSGDQIGVTWIAPVDGIYKQNWIRAVTVHPDGGWLTTGEGCEDPCAVRRLEIGRFSATGERLSLVRDEAQESWGNGVGVDSQGRVIVAVSVKKNGLDAHAQARPISSDAIVFETVYPSQADTAEEALAVVIDLYDRPFYGGYATGGDLQKQAFVERLHP